MLRSGVESDWGTGGIMNFTWFGEVLERVIDLHFWQLWSYYVLCQVTCWEIESLPYHVPMRSPEEHMEIHGKVVVRASDIGLKESQR